MSKILCPFCFEKFKSSQTLFRCINSRCSGQAPDKTYAKYQGLLSAPKLGLSFALREGGIKKIAGLFQGPREVSCPTCQRPTPKRICPTCHYELMYDAGRTKERTIAVIGGRSAGKSIYITTLIHCLFNQVGTNFNAGVMARGDLTRNRYQNDFYKPLYSEGRLLPPTQTAEVNVRTKTPMVFRVTIDDGGKRQAVNLVLFDTAGEDMQNLDTMSTEARYICYSDGIIFLLDPLQIEAVRQQLSDDTQLPPLDPGAEPVQIVERLYELHERQFELKATAKIKKPVAFTLAKADTLMSIIDPSSALHSNGEHFGYLNLADVESVHVEISSYLQTWLRQQFNNLVKSNFGKYRFFAVSSLGGAPTDSRVPTISPLRVEDPLLWIFHQFGIIKGKK